MNYFTELVGNIQWNNETNKTWKKIEMKIETNKTWKKIEKKRMTRK